jgi:hypothetical protein
LDVLPPDPPSFAPYTSTAQFIGELAQLGERLVCNQEVTGSSPVFSTMFFRVRRPAMNPL